MQEKIRAVPTLAYPESEQQRLPSRRAELANATGTPWISCQGTISVLPTRQEARSLFKP